ncbi:hypothetical protein GW17_00034492 [Ensete ventricosum]|nr:hypothetical protein GW17_00034492 [Ensete ventricosum]
MIGMSILMENTRGRPRTVAIARPSLQPLSSSASNVPSSWVIDTTACSHAVVVLLLRLLSLGRLFLRRPPLFLSSLPSPLVIPAISLPSLVARTKLHRRSPAALTLCSQPLPLVAVTAALVCSSKKIATVIAALVGLYRCLLPSLPVASSPRPPAASSYDSSLRPAATAKPSSDAPAPATGQPLSSSSMTAKALTKLSLSSSLPPLSFLPSAAVLAGPRYPLLLFPATSTVAKPSSAATLITSSSL